jgi:hypothetical protein
MSIRIARRLLFLALITTTLVGWSSCNPFDPGQGPDGSGGKCGLFICCEYRQNNDVTVYRCESRDTCERYTKQSTPDGLYGMGPTDKLFCK